jgi:tetratricopeptide (TPR) repeat protein
MAPNLDNDDDIPVRRSRAPLVVGVLVLLGGVGAFVATRGSGSLTEEERKTFDEAQDLLRLDDYQRYPESEKKLLALLTVHPDHVEPAVWLTQLYCAWGEELNWEADVFKKSATEAAKEVTDLKTVAETSKSKRARKEATEDFEEARKKLRTLERLNNVRSVEGADKLREAKKWAQKAGATDYSDASLHRAMADHARITGKWDEVTKQLEYVERQKPDSAGLRFVRGVVALEKDKDLAKADALFDEALSKDPKFMKALYFKALVADRKGDREGAAALMKKVLEGSPGHPNAQAYLGLLTLIQRAERVAADAKKAGTEAEKVEPGDEAEAAAAPPAH